MPLPPSEWRLRAVKKSDDEKLVSELLSVDQGIRCLKECGFRGVGHFLDMFLHIPSEDCNIRSTSHIHAASTFLSGRDLFTPSDLVDRMYHHPYSNPSFRSMRRFERDLAAVPLRNSGKIHYARPALSSWALTLVGEKVHLEVGKMTRPDKNDESDITQLRAATNGRGRPARVVTWADVEALNVNNLGQKFKRRAPIAMYLIECMAAPRSADGQVIVRKQRPYQPVSIRKNPYG
jgi:hypothetical protein